MILANITTYIGQCGDATHYYCYVKEYDTQVPPISFGGYSHDELTRELDEAGAEALNAKDRTRTWHVGSVVNRFDSIEQIHQELLSKYAGNIIVSYYEDIAFKGMLCVIDGDNKGYKFFGEVWTDVPNSCWKDLLPPEADIKIKCRECGAIHKLEDVSEVKELRERHLVQFLRKRDVDDPCCRYYDLIWNVIL